MKVVIFCDDGCDSLDDQYDLYKCVSKAVLSYPKSVEFSIVTVNERLRDFLLNFDMRKRGVYES